MNENSEGEFMDDAILKKFTSNNFSVVDSQVFSQIKSQNADRILANLLKNQQALRHTEQDALIAIIGNFEGLKTIISNSKDVDDKMKSIIYTMINNICDKFEEFYHYSLYLQYEKKSYQMQAGFHKKVLAVASGAGDNIDVQSKKVLASELTSEAQEINHNATLLQKGFNYQQKKMDEAIAKHTFYDYVELFDSEMNILGKALGKMNLPESLLREISTWYKALERQIEQQVTKVNIARTHFNDYCKKIGLKPIRSMKKKDYVISLLKLYNPGKKIDYDFFSDKLYLPNINGLRLPNGFVIDHVRHELYVNIFNTPLVLGLGENYTLSSFTARIQKINPQGKVYLEETKDGYVIVSDIKLEDLVLPMEFDAKTDSLTNKTVISNEASGQTEKFSFGFRYVPKKVKTVTPVSVKKFKNKEEVMAEIIRLNGEDKAMVLNGRLLTTIKKIREFKLPAGFYNDAERNITNKKNAGSPEEVITITIRYTQSLPKKKVSTVPDVDIDKELKEKTDKELEDELAVSMSLEQKRKADAEAEAFEAYAKVPEEPVKAEPKKDDKKKKVVEIKKSLAPKKKKVKRMAVGLLKVIGQSSLTIGAGLAYGIVTPISWLLDKMRNFASHAVHSSFEQLQKDYEEIIMESKHLTLPPEQKKEFEKSLSQTLEAAKEEQKPAIVEPVDEVGEYSLDDILREYEGRGR